MSIYSLGSTIASATSASADTSNKSTSSANKLSENMDTFLTLLVAQLKNQDPLDPTDTNQFTQQLVQYSEVEQSIQVNSNLETLISNSKQSEAMQAVSYIGKTVQVDSNYVPLQDGKAEFSYTLDKTADTCVVTLTDTKGDVVLSFSGERTAGTYPVEWDGTNADGKQLEDGAYLITVTALASGEAVTTSSTAYGKVTDVASDGDNVAVGLGKVVVYLKQVMSVHDRSTTVSSKTNSETTAGAGTETSAADENA